MRNFKLVSTIVIIVLYLSLIPTQVAHADAGPKLPPVTLNFKYEDKLIEIKEVTLLACDDSQCQKSKSAGAITCWEKSCFSHFSPVEAPYYKLTVIFSDKERTSNIFTRVRLSAIYDVKVSKDSLHVKEVFYSGLYSESLTYLFFAPALLITIFSEEYVASLFSKKWKIRLKWTGTLNIISLTIVWYAFPMLPISFGWIWVLAEIFAVVFEAKLLGFTNKECNLSNKQLWILSLTMNSSSLLVGMVIPSILYLVLWIILSF